MTVFTPSVSAVDVLTFVQQNLSDSDLDAFVVPTSDPHLSEYVAPRYRRRELVTGFTGSAGTAIVLADPDEHSILLTDSRYTVQAKKQVSPDFWNVRLSSRDDDIITTLRDLAGPNRGRRLRVSVDPSTVSERLYESLTTKLEKSVEIIACTGKNTIDEAWELVTGMTIDELEAANSRESHLEAVPRAFMEPSLEKRLEDIAAWTRARLPDEEEVGLLVSSRDDIAWLLGLRAFGAIPYSTLFNSYLLLVTQPGAAKLTLFLEPVLSAASAQTVAGVAASMPAWVDFSQRPYGALEEALRAHTCRVVIDPKETTQLVAQCLGARALKTPLEIWRSAAVKSAAELTALRSAQERDVLALAAAFARVAEETSAPDYGQTGYLRELDVVDVLTACRAEQGARGDSFEPIVAAGANSALPHYEPSAEAECNSPLRRNCALLVDTGGIYDTGLLTDITRTLWIGPDQPPAQLVRAYTAVLQGHIAAASVVLPAAFSTATLDAISRAPLWRLGADYGHSVGHGVGVSVHEAGVHTGGTRVTFTGRLVAARPGMVLTVEPGCYAEGHWGVRLENDYEVCAVDPASLDELARISVAEDTLGAATRLRALTYLPFEPKLVDFAVLTGPERLWLHSYHKTCAEIFARLSTDQRTLSWVNACCEPFVRLHDA